MLHPPLFLFLSLPHTFPRISTHYEKRIILLKGGEFLLPLSSRPPRRVPRFFFSRNASRSTFLCTFLLYRDYQHHEVLLALMGIRSDKQRNRRAAERSDKDNGSNDGFQPTVLPPVTITFDDMSTPWPTNDRSRRTSEYTPIPRELPQVIASGSPLYIGHDADHFWEKSLTERAMSSPTTTDIETTFGKEKLRRLLALQRRKYRELLKAERDAFTSIIQKEEGSVRSIEAFTAFRASLQRNEEVKRAKMGRWEAQTLAIRLNDLIEEEQEKRRLIRCAEFRIRDARQRVERVSGIAMHLQLAMQSLFSSEEVSRELIERLEMSEARRISALEPFLSLKYVGVLGQCPFLSLKDCPFHRRGEGVCSNHYRFTQHGKD
uniref:Uncharacterized protein n=1 Tax=Trypanosoma congolense (strain IL3000) TaxID=1068625 RepID=G0UPP2_TRYCI|nr:conserved hypothetical protein [Trypanosoma congolense IL3000]